MSAARFAATFIKAIAADNTPHRCSGSSDEPKIHISSKAPRGNRFPVDKTANEWKIVD
jgi:hypothetical protein